MRKYIILLLAIFGLLFGCATPHEPAVKVIVQEVKVPVRDTCIKPSAIPVKTDYITVDIKKTDSRTTKAKKLIVHYNQSETYIKTLETIIKGCSE